MCVNTGDGERQSSLIEFHLKDKVQLKSKTTHSNGQIHSSRSFHGLEEWQRQELCPPCREEMSSILQQWDLRSIAAGTTQTHTLS